MEQVTPSRVRIRTPVLTSVLIHPSAWKGNSQKLDFCVIRYARMVLSTVSSGHSSHKRGRPPCRCDEGCVSLPDQSPHRCRNLPTVHPGQRIAETLRVTLSSLD